MHRIYTDEEWKRMQDNYDKVRYKCKCGHRSVIPKNVEKTVCSWCGNYVFKDKKTEFQYRMAQNIKRGKYDIK